MYGTMKERPMIPHFSRAEDGHIRGYEPFCYKGQWVRYDVKRLMKKDRLRGIGMVKFAWVYDSLIVEIDSPQHGKVSAFMNVPSDYDREHGDKLWAIEEPLVLREGVGL